MNTSTAITVKEKAILILLKSAATLAVAGFITLMYLTIHNVILG
jgi:hypothetical protein